MNINDAKKALNSVLIERHLQDEKWGEQNHSLERWVTILGEEYGELCKAVNEFSRNNPPLSNTDLIGNIREEVIHTAAVSVALIEYIDRWTKYKI